MIRQVKYSRFIEEAPVVRDWIDDKGREILDKTPRKVAIPQLSAPTSLMEMVHNLYRQMKEQDDSVETFEDADNFDIADEIGIEMMDTPYEQNFDHIEPTPEPSGTPKTDSTVPNPSSKPVQE